MLSILHEKTIQRTQHKRFTDRSIYKYSNDISPDSMNRVFFYVQTTITHTVLMSCMDNRSDKFLLNFTFYRGNQLRQTLSSEIQDFVTTTTF